jgi:hypothetical protein
MTVVFAFAIGDLVTIRAHEIDGVITNAAKGRGGAIGYWIEYKTERQEIREVYALEAEIVGGAPV